MLDPWIIEEIKRREQRSRIEQQPRVEVPLQGPERDRGDKGGGRPAGGEEDAPRGIVIIDYGVACW
jgi:hypothetical protein